MSNKKQEVTYAKLKEDIFRFYGRLNTLNGVLYHFSGIIKRQTENLKIIVDANQDNPLPSYFYGASFLISDISGITENGWELPFVADLYYVDNNNFNDEIRKMLQRQASYSIAQAFEALISFYNTCILMSLPSIDIDNMKSAVKFEKLVSAIPMLEKAYLDNNLNLNVFLYFEALAFFRHKVTHSDFIFSLHDKGYNKLQNNGRAVLKRFFPFIKSGKNFEFAMDVQTAKANLKIIGEIAFQAFKHIAKMNNEKWDIFNGMPTNNKG